MAQNPQHNAWYAQHNHPQFTYQPGGPGYPPQNMGGQAAGGQASSASLGQQQQQTFYNNIVAGHGNYGHTTQAGVPEVKRPKKLRRHGGPYNPRTTTARPARKGHAGGGQSHPQLGGLNDRSNYQGHNSYYAQNGQAGWPVTGAPVGAAGAGSHHAAGSSGNQPGNAAGAWGGTNQVGMSGQGVGGASTSREDLISRAEDGSTLSSIGEDMYMRTRQRNKMNFYHNHGRISLFKPTLDPQIVTKTSGRVWFKDILQREGGVHHEENSFLDPNDGKLNPLDVQAVDYVFDALNNSTWRRTFVRNISPLVVRVSNWTIDLLLADRKGWNAGDWALLVGKWILSCVALFFMISFTPMEPKLKNGGCYDPIPYKDWDYARSPSNLHESDPTQTDRAIGENIRLSLLEAREQMETEDRADTRNGILSSRDIYQHFNPESNRTLRPRYLCILNNPGNRANLLGFHLARVDQWMMENELSSHPEYLFVAYTAKQFNDEGHDVGALLDLAERATRDAGLEAFWLGSRCLHNSDQDGIIDDVWRMSDIVRGANALAIVVGHPVDQRGPSDEVHVRDMLLGWGKRMWTLPEALLSPKGSAVRVYVRGMNKCQIFEKRSLAVQIWSDAAKSRQLMDHFEGSVTLSPLELVVIALQCLNGRDTNIYDFDSQIKGEMAYVLMGLLRRRPRVNLADSAFQAFARLSLANDSHLLLERLVCVMPKLPDQRWHDTADYWDAQLWDIYPSCQIAGIGSGDSVILDGAFGASIRWDQFERVKYAAKKSFRRFLSQAVLRLSPLLLTIGLPLVIFKSSIAGGMALVIVGSAILAASPYLVRLLFTGKLWDTQAFFFGFEGYMDIATIETHIFGAYMKRLTWSPFSSPLSRHRPGDHGECVGQDPTSDPAIRKLVADIYRAENDHPSAWRNNRKRVFTIVDTYTMTVTMFEAERPPVAVLICGAEGGMQRAVLCSYFSATHTFSREAVLRMETRVLGRMSRVARLRFCFRRNMLGVKNRSE